MAGKAKGPWKWAQRNRWCATINGKRVPLDADPDDEEAARKEWHRRMGEVHAPARIGASMSARSLLRLHADYLKDNKARDTHLWYANHFKSFCKLHGEVPVSEIRPHHVDSWVAANSWAKSTERGAITAVKVAFAWARKRGHIEANPLQDVEKPRRTRRKAIIADAQVEAIKKEMKDGPFRDLFLAVLFTGCRPGEACKVEARDFDPEAATWTLHGKTTNVTGKQRVVYLPAPIVEICKRLAAARPTGPIFRNVDGNPWNRYSYGHRVRRMRAKLKLGPEVVLSSLRHLFITDALEKGVPIATVAELAGHSGVAMVSEAYSMLHQRTDHLREAANLVRSHDRTSGHTGEASEGQGASPSAPPGTPPRRRRGPKP